MWLGPSNRGFTQSSGFPVLLSRGLPVFTSTGTAANVLSSSSGSSYNTIWSSTASTATVALDISTLSAAQKTTMALYWYDETGTDTTTLYWDVAHATGGGGVQNNQPTAYTVEGNTGAGGGSPPGSGWTTLQTISNGYASRRHVLSGASSLAGYNWVRMNISASSSSTISLKLDLFDISGGNRDIFQLGDSRGWFGNVHRYPHGGSSASDSFGDLMQPTCGFFAPHFTMGMSGAKAADMDSLSAGWISALGAPYACTMEIGINDATASGWSSAWTTHVQNTVNAWLAAGVTKFFLETIGDSTSSGVHTNVLTYLSPIAGIISGTTDCYAGFDTYTFLNSNPGYISGDQIHETDAGFVALTAAKAAYYATRI